MQTYFLSGCDTGIGKTHVGCLLVQALLENGISVSVKKPIESGCPKRGDQLVGEDITAYQIALGNNTPVEDINCYRYEPAISPERAIRLNEDRITVKDLQRACEPREDCDVLLVEGAGGFYSPLCSDGLNADLAFALNARVLLVVSDRLGCINQTLLCLQAIQQRGLICDAVILNQYRSDHDDNIDNLEDLKQFVNVPVIPIPYKHESSEVALKICKDSSQALVELVKNRM